jgi:hypothetical protein
VTAVNEVANQEEVADAKVGTSFTEFFFVKKKDGTANKYALAALRERLTALLPLATSESPQISEMLSLANGLQICATLKRTVDKKDDSRYNFRLKDVILL